MTILPLLRRCERRSQGLRRPETAARRARNSAAELVTALHRRPRAAAKTCGDLSEDSSTDSKFTAGIAYGLCERQQLTMTKPELKPGSQELLAGLVERVTSHNEDNGFCGLRTSAR